MTDRGRPVVVIGAGAAGLMAALSAARSGAPVLLLESTADGGRKILISGGGRCNVLPSRFEPERYITASSPNTMRKILRSWPLPEQRAFFEDDLGIPLKLEPESGKLFPVSDRAREVRDALVARVLASGAEVRFATRVTGLEVATEGAGWRVRVEGGGVIGASAVVVATGGLSVPKTGSDGTGLRLVEALGHTITPLYPALTPLTADPPRHADLAGISLDVSLETSVGRGAFTARGGFLFTHRGYSGPSVLDISHVAVRSRARGARQEIRVAWGGRGRDVWDALLRETSSRSVASTVRPHLPTRLADALIAAAAVDPARRLGQLRREERERLVQALGSYPLPWTGDEGYKKAEVTGGGVALGEIDPRTMESRLRPRLFPCGEMLDAFGPIGGYNFLWAWATGRAAGRGAAAAVTRTPSGPR